MICKTKLWAMICLVLLGGCGVADNGSNTDFDAEIAGQGVDEWLSYGRDYTEQRFVPLDQVNVQNMAELGLAFSVPLKARYGISATPLLVDGMLILPLNFGEVVAIDARTGDEAWFFDPKMPKSYMRVMGGAALRGVASYGDKILTASTDGRLFALSATDGSIIWETDTFDGGKCNGPVPVCFVSGAPRAARGLVFIGFGGSENNARGYISAYDVDTGELKWRFFTVPGDPDNPEHPEMELAAETWAEGWNDSGLGGGGTVWDAITYDADFDQLIIGTSNGGPVFAREIRSPGGGDNLFVASTIALDVETGKMNWYYQQIPGEQYDYTATSALILADLEINEERRKVVMQAPKHGFFYVIDREDGSLISAEKFAHANWAERIDLETGRPIESEAAANYAKQPAWLTPTPIGAGSWQPMAFDPGSGLAYIPGRDGAYAAHLDENIREPDDYKVTPGRQNTGQDLAAIPGIIAAIGPPPIERKGSLKAYDPIKGEIVWRADMPHIFNGGALVTAGGLVFMGNSMGDFEAFDAANGERLWSFDAYTSIMGAPISYELDGVQYVAIATGLGMMAQIMGYSGPTDSWLYGNDSELLVFKLGGTTEYPEPELVDRTIPEPPEQHGSLEDIVAGGKLYHMHCLWCHGIGGRSDGGIPDLRMMSVGTHQAFDQIVLDGLLEQGGMAGFSDLLTTAEAQQIRAYLINVAQQDYVATVSGDQQ